MHTVLELVAKLVARVAAMQNEIDELRARLGAQVAGIEKTEKEYGSRYLYPGEGK